MKPTTIYCLKNPLDKNTIFYVGRTIQPLNTRLNGHISANRNIRMMAILQKIKEAGLKPIIEPLEVCTGYFLPSVRERYWIRRINQRKSKLINSIHAKISYKKMNLYLELARLK